MRHPPAVPQLQEHPASCLMHCVGDGAPAGDLLGTVDAGRRGIADCRGTDLRAFADDQPGAGALPVILEIQLLRHAVGAGAVARQRRHDHAVFQGDGTELHG